MIYVRTILLLILLLALSICNISAQNIYSAKIINSTDSLSASGISIVSFPSQSNTLSDIDGFFSLSIQITDTAICFIDILYEKQCFLIAGNLPKTIFLKPKNNQIEEIVITTENKKHIESISGGELILSSKQLKQLPQILGETDILKILTFMPGVNSASELSSGISVRGGNSDQNLVLLDGALLFNPTHLFGFLSSFNSDIVSEVTLIKSNIPAEYGNALSSVLSVETDSKIAKKPEFSGSIGLIAPRLSVKLPFLNRKVQLVLSARRTFIDQVINNTRLKNSDFLNGTNYYFYDLNGKINIRPNSNSYIELSVYSGFDDFKFVGNYSFLSQNRWGNKTASAKYIYRINENANIKFTGTYSNYFNTFKVTQDVYSLKMESEISSGNFKFIYENNLTKKHTLRTGLEFARNSFSPNSNTINADSIEYETGNGDLFYTAEYAGFVSDKYNISTSLSMSMGLRLTVFHHLGPFNRFVRNENNEITDTIKYSNNEIIKQYIGLEPRLGLRYIINNSTSLKFSTTRNIQYRHLVAMSSVALPVDVWMPATEFAKPQIGYHFSAGWYKSIKQGTYKFSIDTYYKFMHNVYEYGEDILQLYKNLNYDEGFTEGKGNSYGIEFFITKEKGRFSGQVSYTLSRSMRQISGLNNGEKFHSQFDRANNLVLLGKYNISERVSISANFVFLSGTRMTIPTGRYLIQRNVINIYSPKNAYKLPPYHRLDIGLNFVLKDTDKFESKLNISVYNVYSRKNLFYLYFNISGDISNYELNIKAEQVSLFPILPSISWSFKF